MTQQDAYEKIAGIMTQIDTLVAEARTLASNYDIEFEYSGYHELVDPEDAWESSDSWDDSGC